MLACDGLFEVMTPRGVTDFVRAALLRHGDVQRAAEELVHEAVQVRHTTDNVSAVVVVLTQAVPRFGSCNVTPKSGADWSR